MAERNLKQLALDWKEHPSLKMIACRTVHQLAEHLEKIHKELMNDQLGPSSCYLYQKAIQRNVQLRKELEACQAELQTKGK